MHSRYWLTAFLLAVVACDCGTAPAETCTTSADCPSGQVCVDEQCIDRGVDSGPDTAIDAPDGGIDGDVDAPDSGPECTMDDECGDGVCVEGSCCAMESACGALCCDEAATCFANACVVPGRVCTSAGDCAEGEYCELGLGEGSGELCMSAMTGRCLELPPSCEDSGPGEPCIRTDCEFRPEVGDLDAVVQWRWGPEEVEAIPEEIDVWSTPVVGRVFDTNCDGSIDALDPSAIIFVSGDAASTQCRSAGVCADGVLRALNGATGEELWSLEAVDGSVGFSAVSMALGDLDDDGVMDIVVATGERRLAAISGEGTLMGMSEGTLPAADAAGFGWGGGLALADMDGDGDPEVAWRGTVYTWRDGAFELAFDVPGVVGGWVHSWASASTSVFVDLDADEDLELLVGRAAIDSDGTFLWNRTDIGDGFAAVADFDMDGEPDIVLVTGGQLFLLDGETGSTRLGPFPIPGTGSGGPPTIADFDGDGVPEIGVAKANFYSMIKADFEGSTFNAVWSTQNHDNSSSVTGSTVFDFEGDGIAEVIYNDECWMWVYDGPTGDVRFFAPTNSFTGTEASLVADVDGDGHAEMVMISTGADPTTWSCAEHTTGEDGYPIWEPPSYGPSWRGLSVFRDAANSWVGTRTMWTQHAYHVTNTCDDRDSACPDGSPYGSIPTRERKNWTLPWLNNFRQNVQDEGLFDAPDATVELRAMCTTPVTLVASVRDQGPAPLPAGVRVAFFRRDGATEVRLGDEVTTTRIFPGRAAEVSFTVPEGVSATSTFFARIEVDEDAPLFRQCDDGNDQSDDVIPRCIM